MNPLLQDTQQTNSPNLNSIMDFAKNTTPEAAKSQIDQMVASGQLSQQRLHELQAQAQGIARMLGM